MFFFCIEIESFASSFLKTWMIEKRDAQIKLMGYIEEAAIFLGSTRTDPDGVVRVNKIPDFIRLKGQQQQQQPSQGQQIEFLGFE